MTINILNNFFFSFTTSENVAPSMTTSSLVHFVQATATLTSTAITTNMPSDGDAYCEDLDFFVKLLLLLTGDCDLNITRKQLISYLKPVSKYSSYLSITAWLFAQLPQVIKNYSSKSVHGVSLGFLLCWFLGDFLNFTSCILTDAMAFQVMLSSYYIFIDLILAGQFYYYSQLYHNPHSRFFHKKKSQRLKPLKSPKSALRESLLQHAEAAEAADSVAKTGLQVPQIHVDPIVREHIGPIKISSPKMNEQKSKKSKTKKKKVKMASSDAVSDFDPHEEQSEDPEDEDDLQKGGVFRQPNNSITQLISSSFIVGFSKVQGLPLTEKILANEKTNNSVIFKIIHMILTADEHQLGKILAWSCTILYLTSRIPQIVTNYKLRSTSGISMKLICCVLLGNIFYSVSLITCKASLVGGEVSKDFWAAELSYLIGALGTVIFDFMVVVQWYHWNYKESNRHTVGGVSRYPIVGGDNSYNHHLQMNVLNNLHSSTTSGSTGNTALLRGKSPIAIVNNNRGSSSPINLKTPLSPSHARKLSEFTPLSPIDFLLDDYMASAQSFKIPNNNTNSNMATNNINHHTQHYNLHPPEQNNHGMDGMVSTTGSSPSASTCSSPAYASTRKGSIGTSAANNLLVSATLNHLKMSHVAPVNRHKDKEDFSKLPKKSCDHGIKNNDKSQCSKSTKMTPNFSADSILSSGGTSLGLGKKESSRETFSSASSSAWMCNGGEQEKNHECEEAVIDDNDDDDDDGGDGCVFRSESPKSSAGPLAQVLQQQLGAIQKWKNNAQSGNSNSSLKYATIESRSHSHNSIDGITNGNSVPGSLENNKKLAFRGGSHPYNYGSVN